MDWPSYSPDVNPMENIWAIMKRNVSKRNPQNIQELIEAIHNECENFSQTTVSNIFHSIYNRVDQLIECRGNALSY